MNASIYGQGGEGGLQAKSASQTQHHQFNQNAGQDLDAALQKISSLTTQLTEKDIERFRVNEELFECKMTVIALETELKQEKEKGLKTGALESQLKFKQHELETLDTKYKTMQKDLGSVKQQLEQLQRQQVKSLAGGNNKHSHAEIDADKSPGATNHSAKPAANTTITTSSTATTNPAAAAAAAAPPKAGTNSKTENVNESGVQSAQLKGDSFMSAPHSAPSIVLNVQSAAPRFNFPPAPDLSGTRAPFSATAAYAAQWLPRFCNANASLTTASQLLPLLHDVLLSVAGVASGDLMRLNRTSGSHSLIGLQSTATLRPSASLKTSHNPQSRRPAGTHEYSSLTPNAHTHHNVGRFVSGECASSSSSSAVSRCTAALEVLAVSFQIALHEGAGGEAPLPLLPLAEAAISLANALMENLGQSSALVDRRWVGGTILGGGDGLGGGSLSMTLSGGPVLLSTSPLALCLRLLGTTLALMPRESWLPAHSNSHSSVPLLSSAFDIARSNTTDANSLRRLWGLPPAPESDAAGSRSSKASDLRIRFDNAAIDGVSGDVYGDGSTKRKRDDDVTTGEKGGRRIGAADAANSSLIPGPDPQDKTMDVEQRAAAVMTVESPRLLRPFNVLSCLHMPAVDPAALLEASARVAIQVRLPDDAAWDTASDSERASAGTAPAVTVARNTLALLLNMVTGRLRLSQFRGDASASALGAAQLTSEVTFVLKSLRDATAAYGQVPVLAPELFLGPLMDIVVGPSVDTASRRRALQQLCTLLRSRNTFLAFMAIQGFSNGDADRSFLFMLVKQLTRQAPPLVDSKVDLVEFSAAAALILAGSSAVGAGVGAAAGANKTSPSNKSLSFSPAVGLGSEFATSSSGGLNDGYNSQVWGCESNCNPRTDGGSGSDVNLSVVEILRYQYDAVQFLVSLLELHGSLAVAPMLGIPFRSIEVPGAERWMQREDDGDKHQPASQFHKQHQKTSERVVLHPDDCFDTHLHDPSHLDVETINRLASLWVHRIRSLDLAPPILIPESEEYYSSLIARELTKLLNEISRRMPHGQWPSLINNLLETINATLSRWNPVGSHGYFHPSLDGLENHLQHLDYLSYGMEYTSTMRS